MSWLATGIEYWGHIEIGTVRVYGKWGLLARLDYTLSVPGRDKPIAHGTKEEMEFLRKELIRAFDVGNSAARLEMNEQSQGIQFKTPEDTERFSRLVLNSPAFSAERKEITKDG